MKRLVSFVLMLAMACTLCSCGQGDESSNTGTSSEASVHAGTRSDPYEFSDKITIGAKAEYGEEYVVEYTVNLDEVWSSSKVSNEYPNYSIDDRILVRANIDVTCDATDDEIDFGLRPTFVTSSLNEEEANIQTYKTGELNNQLYTVYSGGSYDVIILGNNDGIGSLDITFLKINYTDVNGESTNIWIKMPEETENGADVSANATDSSENNMNSESSGETLSSVTTAAPQVVMTSEELDALLLEQPMYVESTNYVVQSDEYKTLYPDMLQAMIKNNSGTDVKNAVVAFVAWDNNGFPIKIFSSGVDLHGAYIKVVNYGDVNMTNGSSFGSDSGFSIDADKCDIATFKAIVVSYDDFDGNTWNNPYYDTWVGMYSDKKLS